MKKYTPFLIFWALDAVLLWLANLVYPTYYVLGNARLSAFMATIVAGLVWTALVWYLMPLTKKLKIKPNDMLKNMFFWLGVNFVSLWLIARLSALFGFGVTSFVWVFALAFVANLVQWGAWSLTSKK